MSFYPPSADRLSLRFSGNETVQATETTKTASPTEATSQTSAQPTTYDKQLREFQAVFQRLGVFKKYGNARNLDKRFHELPDPIREKIATILKDGKLTPQDMERYFKEHKMGKIEECADMAFEFHILRAMTHGVVGESQIYDWIKQLERIRDTGRIHKRTALKAEDFVRQELSEKQFSQFHKMSGYKDRALSDHILVIGTLKPARIALINDPRQKHVIIPFTRVRMGYEVEEFTDELRDAPIVHFLMKQYVKAMMLFEPLFGEKLMVPPKRTVKRLLGLKALTDDDFAKYVLFKQRIRMMVNLDHIRDFSKTKELTKPFEALYEASIIKDLEIQSNAIKNNGLKQKLGNGLDKLKDSKFSHIFIPSGSDK